MVNEPVQRKLAAILAADVVGFSSLMERDEEGTYARIGRLRREVIEPRLSEQRGRLIKTTGDGFLAEFASSIAALRCAIAIQGDLGNDPDPLRIRIGLNLGDVIVEDSGDVYGEGVNVAARLEALCDPGGILISGKIHSEVDGKVEAAFEDRGEQQIKNISRPVRIYAVRPVGTAKASAATASSNDVKKPLQLPDKPSIAVLPFQNMSGDPEQEYFADGMVEEIITALSRLRWLFVIARASSFTFKGKSVDVKQVGRELGVRYVLEGSVRKIGKRVRLTGQLLDASTGLHLWADRFDGALEDIFDLQDRLTIDVVGAIAPRLERAETERAKRKPTENLDAYDCYLQAMAKFYEETLDSNNEALRLLYRSMQLDPDYAAAYGMAAWCYARAKTNGWTSDPVKEKAEAAKLARRAVNLGKEDSVALGAAGFALAYSVGAFDEGVAAVDRALALNPNDPAAWYFSGTLRLWMGEPEFALEHLARATRLNPLDLRVSGLADVVAAFAHFFAGRYDEACLRVENAICHRPNFVPALLVSAGSHALAGRIGEANKAVARLRELKPNLRVGDLNDQIPVRRPADLARCEEGLRLAGLPES